MAAGRKTVLVIDAQDEARERLSQTLRRDYRVIRAASAEAGLALMDKEDVDVLVADVAQPGLGGIDLLQIVRENFPLVEIIMTSAEPDVDGAVRAIKLGAYHFLTKDADPDVLRELVRHAGERQDLHRHVLTLQDAAGDAGGRDFITGPSTGLKDVLETVHKVAKLSATVLILGESGTGKELLARLLHRESANPEAPFIAVNVAAIPRELVESTLFGHEKGSFTGALQQRIGKFELANGGTLFLDEIGDLKPDLQAKLLRAIQEGEVERVGGSRPIRTQFRLIAATNVDLERAVKEGVFREDLYYRLNVIPVRLPPLRERIEDLPVARRLLHQALQRALPQGRARHRRIDAGDAVAPSLAGQHPRARKPDRASRRGDRSRIHHRRGSAVRVSRRGAGSRQVGHQPAGSRDGDVRAEFPGTRARAERLERHADRALPGRAAEHVEVQDGAARNPRARPRKIKK